MNQDTKKKVESLIGKTCTYLLESNGLIVATDDEMNNILLLNGASTISNLAWVVSKTNKDNVTIPELLEYSKALSALAAQEKRRTDA